MRLTALAIFALAAFYSARAAASPVQVIVSDPSGKVAYRGTTAANGGFATPALPGGEYTVQFRSPNAKGDHSIVLSAGKKKVTADVVSGPQFGGAGLR